MELNFEKNTNSSYPINTTLKVLLKEFFKISRPELQNTSGLFFTRHDANNQGVTTICEIYTKLIPPSFQYPLFITLRQQIRKTL